MPSGNPPYVCNLPEEIQRIAASELNENPKTREESIQHIRDWINKNSYLNARTDSKTILRFLRGCKFSLERTKEKIEMYYTCKTVFPEMLSHRNPASKTLQSIFEMRLMVPLPGYDSEGRKIILGRLGAWDPAVVRTEDLFRAASMLFDLLFMEDEQISITGFVQVHDVAGITLRHAAAFNINLVKNMMTIWTEGYPIRPKAVHYVNTTPAFENLYNLFSRFMKDKMKKRIKIHGNNYNTLYSHLPQKMLPQEYGGSRGTLEEINNVWMEKMRSHQGWFLEEENFKVDESKRPAKRRPRLPEMMGRDGSFKQLEFD